MNAEKKTETNFPICSYIIHIQDILKTTISHQARQKKRYFPGSLRWHALFLQGESEKPFTM